MIEFEDLKAEKEWEKYGEWIVKAYHLDSGCLSDLRCVCHHMHQLRFRYENHMDYNREEDGRCLRARYIRHNHRPKNALDGIIGVSVLEVLTAFAYRIDMEYTGIPGESRPDDIFYMFLTNLGLKNYTNMNYNPREVDDILQKWMNRKYGHDGENGLFYIKNCPFDMRDMELWRQMNAWNMKNFQKLSKN